MGEISFRSPTCRPRRRSPPARRRLRPCCPPVPRLPAAAAGELAAPRCVGRRRPPAAGLWPSSRSRSPSCLSPGSSTSRIPPAPRGAHQSPRRHATAPRPPTSLPRPPRPPQRSGRRARGVPAPWSRPGFEASEAHAPSLLAAPSAIPAQARRSRPPRPRSRRPRRPPVQRLPGSHPRCPPTPAGPPTRGPPLAPAVASAFRFPAARRPSRRKFSVWRR
jgi:hypothetical protein